jgi:hypothetical protein
MGEEKKIRKRTLKEAVFQLRGGHMAVKEHSSK